MRCHTSSRTTANGADARFVPGTRGKKPVPFEQFC
jgi:hypothetical protein